MMAEIRDPTGNTGIGAGETVQDTMRDRTTVTARDLVTDEVVTLVGEKKADVREGGMVTTPTPLTKMGINSGPLLEFSGRR